MSYDQSMQLSLTAEQLAELAALEELDQLAKAIPLLYKFEPHSKQAAVMAADAFEVWIYGGNRSGKTEINMVEFARCCDGSHPFRYLRPRKDGQPILVWMLSETSDVQRDTLQRKFNMYIPADWVVKKWAIKDVFNKVVLKVPNSRYGELDIEIVWKTYDQSVDTYESASVDMVVADEEMPENYYSAIQARLLDARVWGNGRLQTALTPTKGKGWSVEKYWRPLERREKIPDGIQCFMFSTYDNAHNLGGYYAVQRLEAAYPEEERSARIYGNPYSKHGFVLHNYRDDYWPNGHLLRPFKPDWRVMTPWESIDYGFSAPCSVGFYAVAGNGEVYRYDEIYVKGKTIPQIKSAIYFKRRQHGYHRSFLTIIDKKTHNRESDGTSRLEKYGDTSKNVWVGAGMEPSDAELVNMRKRLLNREISDAQFNKFERALKFKEGYISYPIPCKESNNSREVGWDTFNDRLLFSPSTGRAGFYVTDNCTEFRREARLAKWSEKKTGKGVDGDDHAIDEARYLIMENPFHSPGFNGIVRPCGINGEQKRVKQ